MWFSELARDHKAIGVLIRERYWPCSEVIRYEKRHPQHSSAEQDVFARLSPLLPPCSPSGDIAEASAKRANFLSWADSSPPKQLRTLASKSLLNFVHRGRGFKECQWIFTTLSKHSTLSAKHDLRIAKEIMFDRSTAILPGFCLHTPAARPRIDGRAEASALPQPARDCSREEFLCVILGTPETTVH